MSNQTEASHTVTLESSDGGTISEQVGPINPLDTATFQRTLSTGTYRSGGLGVRRPQGDPAGDAHVGEDRKSGSDELLLP